MGVNEDDIIAIIDEEKASAEAKKALEAQQSSSHRLSEEGLRERFGKFFRMHKSGVSLQSIRNLMKVQKHSKEDIELFCSSLSSSSGSYLQEKLKDTDGSEHDSASSSVSIHSCSYSHLVSFLFLNY